MLCFSFVSVERRKEGEDWIEKQRADAYHNFLFFLFIFFIGGFMGKKKKEEIIVS